MSLRIRRGTNSQRTGVTLDLGEIAYTTDTKKLYVGDGITAGGINVIKESVGAGLEWNNTLQQIEYTGALGSALQNIVEDTSPELGGNLSLNNRTINGIGAIDITGNITATGLSLATGLLTDLSLNSNDIIGPGAINITGNITATGNINGGNVITNGTISATIGLGEDLPLNTHDINGTGNINITGNISSTGVLTTGEVVITAVNGTLSFTNIQSAQNLKIRRSLPVAGNHTDVYALSVGTFGTGQNVFGSRGTLSAPTILQAGDIISGDIYTGHNGTTYQLSSAINHGIDPFATVNGSTIPGMITFSTFADGNPANYKGMVINSKGFVAINGGLTNPAATLDVNGFAKLAVLTAAPDSPANGMIAIADGTTWNPLSNGKQSMVAYLDGTWREIAAAA